MKRQIQIVIYVLFPFFLIAQTNFNVYYQTKTVTNGVVSYSGNNSYAADQIASDFGPRVVPQYDWHGGVDFSPLPNNADLGYHSIAIEGGRITRLVGSTGYKYFLVDHTDNTNAHNDRKDFGYGHMFTSSGTYPLVDGDMVLLQVTQNTSLFAILNTTTGIAIGYLPQDGRTYTVSYNGAIYTVNRDINLGDVIAPIGTSYGSTTTANVEAHLHLYRIKNINVNNNFISDDNTANPLQFLTYPKPTYNVAYFNPQGNTNPDAINLNGINIVYPSSSSSTAQNTTTKIGARVGMAQGQNLNSRVMDIERVQLNLVRSLGASQTPEANYYSVGYIKGRNLESNIQYGGNTRTENIVYPRTAPNNMLVTQGSWSNQGTRPFAYRDGYNRTTTSYDDFYFTDFVPRLDKNDQTKTTLARIPEDAQNQDGQYLLYSAVYNPNLVTNTQGQSLGEEMTLQTPITPTQIWLDNFKPYIKSAIITKNFGNWQTLLYSNWVSSTDRTSVSLTSSGIYSIGTKAEYQQLLAQNKPIRIVVNVSEPVQNMVMTIPSLNYTGTASIDKFEQTFTYEIDINTFKNMLNLGADFTLNFTAEDYSDFGNNGILALTPTSTSVGTTALKIPKRLSNGTWQDDFTTGTDAAHKFRLQALPACTQFWNPSGEGNQLSTRGILVNECLTPDFNFKTDITNSLNIIFEDKSQLAANIKSWRWNFGDAVSGGNNTSTSPSPFHIFSSPGTYIVTLAVSDNTSHTNPSANITKQVVVVANGSAISLRINAPSVVRVGDIINVNAEVGGASGALTYEWNFGNNCASRNNEYTAGPFDLSYSCNGSQTIRLTVTDAAGKTATSTVNVSVLSLVELDLAATPQGAPLNGIQNYYFAAKLKNIVGRPTFQWFVDGVSQGSANVNDSGKSIAIPTGSHVVSVKVCDQNGCYVATKTVFVGAFTATFTSSVGCGVTVAAGTSVTFTPSVTGSGVYDYFWDFGDGLPTDLNSQTVMVPSHTFNQRGTNNVKLTVTDRNTLQSITTTACSINVPNIPLVINSIDRNPCDPEHIPNQGKYWLSCNRSGGTPFNNGEVLAGPWAKLSSGGVNPDNPTGENAKRFNFTWQITKLINNTDKIIGLENSSEQATFVTIPNDVEWPVKLEVRVTVTGQGGAVDPNNNATFKTIIFLYKYMTLDNNTNISACPDSKIQLSSVLGGKAPLAYTWKIKSGANFVTPSSTEMSCSNCDAPTITVQNGTTLKAYRVNAVDDRGCTFQNDIFVTSSALSLSIDPSSNTQACVGNSAAILKSIVSGGSGKYQYSWTPSNGLATPTQAQTALKAYDLYPTAYTLRVTDQYGCSQTAEARIQGSISTPVANAGNSVASACHGSNITLGGGPTGSGNDLVGGLSYKWSGPSGFTSTVANPVITDARFNMSGTYQVTVTDNGNGCYTTASIPVNILKEITTQGFEALAYVNGCLGTNNTAFTSSQNIVTIGGESGATAPLNYYWTPSTIVSGFSASQVGSQYNFTNPTITPTATDRKSILTISDANGCTKKFPSREFLLSSQTPVINLNRISGSICTSKPVQFKLAIDYKFIELLSRVSVQYQIELDGVNVLTVLPSNGIYTSLPNYNLYNNTITVTPTFTGKHILKIKSISNNCGTSIFEYTFASMSGGSTQTAICNNDNASLLGGVYQGSVVNVANGCIAEVKWGSEATIVASNSITMLPGFAANSGSIYEAKIAVLNLCPTNIIKEEDENSIAFNALNAYPTPFNDRITIEYKIENSDKSDVVISIIDMNGRVVDLLVDDKNKPQGYYKIDYNSTKLSSGNYFILMRINKISKFKKIVKIE